MLYVSISKQAGGKEKELEILKKGEGILKSLPYPEESCRR